MLGTYGLHGSGATVLGFKMYGGKRKPPRVIKALYRLLRRCKDAQYWLRYWLQPSRQFHLIRTGLEPGYYDTDTRILYGCMNLLVQYVEEEQGGETKLDKWTEELHGREHCESQAASQTETLAIYRWWKYQRPADLAREDKWCSILFSGPLVTKPVEGQPNLREYVPTPDEERDQSMGTLADYRAFEDEIEERDQEMLHRLINIRRSLWT